MAKYTINIEYTTGDSFHSEEAEDTVDLEWEDMAVIKIALQRIKEHYKWYKNINGYNRFDPEIDERPKWHKTNMENNTFNRQHVINLPMDDGTEQQIGAFWCGHFETLNAAEIVLVKPEFDGMRVTF